MAHDWIHIGNILFTLCTVHRNNPTLHYGQSESKANKYANQAYEPRL